MKERQDLRRVEHGDISNFPIKDYIIRDCVLLESLPSSSIVYISDVCKPIDRCLIMLESSINGELVIFMSFDNFFAISVPEDYSNISKYVDIERKYNRSKEILSLISTIDNEIIMTSESNDITVKVGDDHYIITETELEDMKLFFYDEYLDFIDLEEDLGFVLKMDKEKFDEFDPSIKEKIKEDHKIKELQDGNIEIYKRNLSFTI